MSASQEKQGIDYFLFIVTFTLIAIGVIWGIIDNDSFIANLTIVKNMITTKMGWFMVVVINLFLGVLVYLAMGRFGSRRLGKDDERPEFSTFSWIALLFGCGIGAGYCFWPIGEPLWHYYSTPFIAESQTPAALAVARSIALFHWGFHQWVIFCIAGLVIAYPAFRLGRPMTIAVALHGLLGEKASTSFAGRVAELCGAFATLTGVAAALGLGLMLFTAGLKATFGIEVGPMGQVVIMLGVIAAYTAAAWSGLGKGIKFLGDMNVWVCLAWFAFILFAGPTSHLLDGMVETWGAYFGNLATMSFFMDATGEANGWPRDWTIFYYLWNTAWAPFVGGFIARISRGRTIREYIFGVLCVPVIVAFVWFGVLGTAAQYVELNQLTNLWEQVQMDPALGVYAVVDAFGGGTIVKLIVYLSVATFLITSADAAAFFVAMQMNRGTLHPSRSQMLMWGFMIGGLAVVLQCFSGLKGIQVAGVIAGAPFIIILCFMVVALFKTLVTEKMPSCEKSSDTE